MCVCVCRMHGLNRKSTRRGYFILFTIIIIIIVDRPNRDPQDRCRSTFEIRGSGNIIFSIRFSMTKRVNYTIAHQKNNTVDL